jgi:CheY-like chemotaxis protein
MAMSRKNNIRIVVADDNRQMRDKIVHLLSSGYEVVGSAADGKAALDVVRLLKPDIAVLDISMPIISGIDVAAEMKKKRISYQGDLFDRSQRPRLR